MRQLRHSSKIALAHWSKLQLLHLRQLEKQLAQTGATGAQEGLCASRMFPVCKTGKHNDGVAQPLAPDATGARPRAFCVRKPHKTGGQQCLR